MTDEQIQQLARVSEGMAHILRSLEDIKRSMQELRQEFVSRPHYDGEIAALKLRLQALEESAKKSPLDAITRIFAAVTVIVGGCTAIYLAAQWVVRHGA